MFISYIRALILYPLLILTVRLMGKRQLGEMEPAEFVVSMLLADLASVPMQDIGIPLLTGVIPILVVLALELLLAVFSMRSIKFRQFFCGKPVILIQDGTILQKALRSARITADELTESLRQKEVTDIASVQYAILETNGTLSVLLKSYAMPPTAKDLGVKAAPTVLPITLISDGRILTENLKKSGHDRQWLNQQLACHGCKPDDVFLLTTEPGGKLFLARKEAH